ncbi:alcohol dehydrogenase catalytic domain-containing protein, partial [Phenylobacterium sp.]|uniref:alcohol dehydrogenase catalytic domain-containing protein n=1 Tax=Phenylobacterium sp. TaxID=1871053 RepID=UPI0025E44BB6
MRALVVEELAAEYAGCRVKDLPDPTPGPGEVLVKVRAGAVNFPDLMQTRGEHQHKPPVPFTPGMEMAGDVVAVGEGVTDWKPGDAVAGGSRTGAFAEYAVSPAGALHRKPEALTYGQAAGYQVCYLTAW